jgi:hypothetical protein
MGDGTPWVVADDLVRLDGALLQLATFTLGQATPDAESFVVLKRVLEALGTHFAAGADALGIPSRSALFGEERLRVGLRTEGVGLPSERIIVVGNLANTRYAQLDRIDEPVFGNPRAIFR